MQIQPTPTPPPQPGFQWYSQQQQPSFTNNSYGTKFNYWPFALFVADALPYAVVVGKNGAES